MSTVGQRNLITDVPGLKVGNADDDELRSGVTVLLADEPAAAAVDLRGGAPGTRETDALATCNIIEAIHGLVFSGGSAFGLDAATGVQAYLRDKGIGFEIGAARVPIVPQAILFDLLNGGDKDWGRRPPYQDLAYQACENASSDFALRSLGAGAGATTARLKGGLGSASLVTDTGITIGALVAVNAAGDVTIGDTPHFWAAPFEIGNEFGGHGWPATWPDQALETRIKARPGEATTLAVVATDARLDRSQLRRLAIAAHTGLARAIYPVHTILDGDIVFALSTGHREAPDPIWGMAELGALAANTLARAVARGVFEATAFPGSDAQPPSYRSRFT